MPELNAVPDFVEKAIFQKRKWISLTGLCNNNCIFCLDGDRTDKFLKSEDEIRKQIDKGRSEGATKLVLSGGEPTMHPKLIDFIRYGREKGYSKIQIVSNGRMLGYRSFVMSLKEAGLDETTFSIHGHTTELHESHTRVPGSFAQITSGIRNTLDAGFIVNTDTVVTKMNYMHLPEIISFLYSLGVTEVNLMNLVPFGNAWNNKSVVFYDYDKVMPYVRKVIDFCEENRMVLWLSRFPAEYMEGYEKYIESYKKIAEDVIAIGEDLFRNPECRGERCRFCGVSSVCVDISNMLNGNHKTSVPDYDAIDFWDMFDEDNTKSITDALPDIVAMMRRDVKLRLIGMPPCVLPPDMWERVYLKKLVPESGMEFNDAAEFICKRNMIKTKSCEGCSFFHDCHGVYREYARKFGFSELKKIKCEEIRITLECNQKCVFCNTDNTTKNVIIGDDEITDTIEKWRKKGICYIIFSGGEPTLHPRLPEFIKQASAFCVRIDIQTNAVLLSDRGIVDRLKESGLSSAFVSFHSTRDSIHRKLTRSVTFDNANAGIKNIIDAGINTSINIVVNKLNYRELPLIVSYINDSFPGISFISFAYVCPVNEALKNKWVIPKIRDTVPYLKKAIDLCMKNGIKATVPARCGIPACLLPGYESFFDAVYDKQSNESDKIKRKECAVCERDAICDGFWKEYVNLYGFE